MRVIVLLACLSGLAIAWLLGRLAVNRLPEFVHTTSRRAIIVVSIATFMVVVLTGAFWGVREIERQTRENTGGVLRVTVETTHETLRLWAETQKTSVSTFARDPELTVATEQIFALHSNGRTVLDSDSLASVQAHLLGHSDGGDTRGYIVVADGINLAALSDLLIGRQNALLSRHPAALQQALAGATVLVLPTRHGDAITEKSMRPSKHEAQASAFAVAPIHSVDGTVAAVLVLPVGPDRHFSRLCQTGRIGESGETYAFSRDGLLSWCWDAPLTQVLARLQAELERRDTRQGARATR
jgi:hypothetical protein